MTLSTSTVTLAPGSSRTYTLAPGEAVTVATEPNCYVTVTETPDVISSADLDGQTNVRESSTDTPSTRPVARSSSGQRSVMIMSLDTMAMVRSNCA